MNHWRPWNRLLWPESCFPYVFLQHILVSGAIFFKLDYLQCLIMFIFVLMKSTRAKMDHLYKFGGNYIFANSQITPKIRIICDKMAISLFTSSVKVNALLALSLFIVSILPLYHTFLGENEMIIPIILPFVDPDTEHGFFINLINQLIFICLGIDAIPACETFFCVLKNTITTTATVIEISIQDFKQLVAEKKGFSAERCRQFRNIIMKIMDFNRFDNFPWPFEITKNNWIQAIRRFVVNFTDLFYWKCLLQPACYVYAIAIGLYLFIVVSSLLYFN